MPEISFDDISQLFRDKTTQNQQTQPPTATNANYTTVASDELNLGTITGPSRPANVGIDERSGNSSNRTSDRVRQRLPYAGQSGDVRVGFTLTSDWWIQQGRAIELHAGPNAVSWNLPLRAQDEDTSSGRARYAQARNASRGVGEGANPTPIYFGFPRMAFQFQAGNLIPISGIGNEVVMPYGLQDFHLFLSLLNQPPLIPDGANEGKHNYVWAFYTSLQFPTLTAKGYFEPDGVSWEDNAEAPTMLQWTSNFVAHELTPNPWEYNEAVAAYQDFMRSTARTF